MSTKEKIKALVRRIFFQYISDDDASSLAFLECICQECLAACVRNPTKVIIIIIIIENRK